MPCHVLPRHVLPRHAHTRTEQRFRIYSAPFFEAAKTTAAMEAPPPNPTQGTARGRTDTAVVGEKLGAALIVMKMLFIGD
jgi:hypothetical protein